MSLIKCDICGEMYSETYHVCPFCEEEEAIRAGRPIQRKAKDFRNKGGNHALGVLGLLMAVVVIGGVGLWAFGDNITEMMGLRQPVEDSVENEVQEFENPNAGVTTPKPDETGGTETTPPESGTATMPEGSGEGQGTGTGDGQSGTVNPQPVTPPATPVKLNSTDVTMVLNETATLKASGGSGKYTWTSSDTSKVVVLEGKVTIVGRASKQSNVKVTVSDGFTQAECIVRVKGGTPVNVTGNTGSGDTGSQGGTTTTTPVTPSELKLNRTDITLSKGEKWTLKVSGTNSQVSWSIGDSSIASLAEDGTVKGLRSGNTTVTAKVDGQTLKCIIRVK